MPPSRLVSTRPWSRDQRLGLSQQYKAKLITVPVKSPWGGFIPDFDYHQLQLSACIECENLQVRIDPSGAGEVLTLSPGWSRIDADRLPLGDATPPAASPDEQPIVFLGQLARTNAAGARTGEFDISPLAITSGDGTTADSVKMYRISPTSGAWTNIAFVAKGAATGPVASRESLPHAAYFPPGASTRTVTANQTGPIAEPVAVWTNNVDPVQVFPAGTGLNTYERLTDSALAPFIARSVATFNSRLYFLNTSEAGTRYRQRIRWTPIGQADPDPAVGVGQGSLDIREFSKDGLRLEPMNDLLAAYYEDGVAFLRPSGVPTAPVQRQILTNQRGLLGTHALTSIGGNVHFGIFTDGWWFLDSSGRWEEVGIGAVDGVPTPKWRRTFYQNLDVQNRHRLYVYYDSPSNVIKVAYPTTTDTDVIEVWNYELNSDRVFIDRYNAGVTCFGSYDRQISSPLLWSTAGTLTWSGIVGSWASFETQFGVRAIVHGDLNGLVFQHDPDLITRDDVAPGYLYASPIKESVNGSRYLLTADRLLMEYVNANSPNATFTIVGTDGTESGVVDINAGAAGSIQTAHRHFRFTRQDLGFKVNGTAPVIIRGFSVDVFDEMGEVRR